MGTDKKTANDGPYADTFIAKLYITDNTYGWATNFGYMGTALTLDSMGGTGNLYYAGWAYGAVAQLRKYSIVGSLQWAKEWNNSYLEDAAYINNNIYAAGIIMNTADFDPGAANDDRTSNGSYDIFGSFRNVGKSE